MKSRVYWLHAPIVTALIFSIMGSLGLLPNFDFIDPVSTALKDFELTDIVFSHPAFNKNEQADTNIVIVNIGQLSRPEIGTMLRRISANKPAVIGIDAFFRKEKGPEFDSTLANALQEAGNVVLVEELSNYNEENETFDTLLTSAAIFTRHCTGAYANVYNEENSDFRTVRKFVPTQTVQGNKAISFPVKICEMVNPKAVQKLYNRDNEIERINYRGNLEKFYTIDVPDMFNTNVDISFIRNKIVLIGFFSLDVVGNSYEDIFFTPLNKRFAGKSFPDMYGIVVHANTISTILNEQYIDTMPDWLSWVTAVVFCYFNILLFAFIYLKYDYFYDLIVRILQIVGSLILLYLTILVFYELDYELNLALTVSVLLLGGDVLDVYFGLLKSRKLL